MVGDPSRNDEKKEEKKRKERKKDEHSLFSYANVLIMRTFFYS